MKNSGKKINLLIILSLFFSINFQIIKAENEIKGNIENGFDLYKKNCTSCHSTDLTKKLIGPALYRVTERRTRDWLHKWIKNNESLRKSGDKDAISIYEKYGKTEMNLFPKLSEEDIDNILAFIKNPPIVKEKKIYPKTNIKNQEDFLIYKKLILIGFGVLSIISLIILTRIYILIKVLNSKTFDEYNINKKISIDFLYILKKYRTLNYLLITIFFILSLFELWNFMMNIDVNKGYEPDQPIYFSHKIHSGINKIDCQYCHSSSKYSKTSGIPSTNVCMNCHLSIQEYKGNYIEKGKSKDFYTSEIQKIYKSIGWNKNSRIYSGKTQPIQWVRIHNMPDFVYFNHFQHVILGEKTIKKSKNVDITCKACHGEVQEMNKIKMANDFTMNWCITCHRTTQVNINNKYYKQYFNELYKKNKKQYHIKNNKKITVDALGGIECAKCHH